jgi:hypothetical protein
MGGEEIRAFISYLNNERKIAGSTYSQALCALLFLYQEVLQSELPWIARLGRPKRPPKRPTVLTPTEVGWSPDMTSAPYRSCWSTLMPVAR